MKLEGRRHRDTTQVKGFSPEIIHYVGGRYCSYSSRQNSHSHYGQGYESPTGSKTVSRCQEESMMNSGGPVQSRSDCTIKPIDGKIAHNMYRQSDYPIVSGKPVKAGREKGVHKYGIYNF